MPGTDYVSVINVHICCSVVPGRAGSYVPGRSVTYENQAYSFLSYKKKYMDWKPPITAFWTGHETNTQEHCLRLAHFFSLSDALSSCVWSTDWSCLLDLTSLFRKMSFISILLGITKPKTRKKNNYFCIWKQ